LRADDTFDQDQAAVIFHRRLFFFCKISMTMPLPVHLQTRLDTSAESAGNGHRLKFGKDVDTAYM